VRLVVGVYRSIGRDGGMNMCEGGGEKERRRGVGERNNGMGGMILIAR
jgi:hypothetical protein